MFVISDQGAFGIGGERRLSSARETEKDGHITLLPLVGGRMQGEDVMLDWHFIEQDSEDTLFHLTRIFCAENNHFLLGKVDGHTGGTGHAGSISVGWK